MNKIFRKKLGYFVTQVVEVHDNARAHLKTSRRARKGLNKLSVNSEDHRVLRPLQEFSSLFSFQPQSLTWWIAILFMVGSACFVAGSVVSLYFEHSFSTLAINMTFFIGSLFFTAAAYCQYLEVINADITNDAYLAAGKTEWIWWAWRAKNLGFMASVCQLAGAFLFNINTFNCFYDGLSYVAMDVVIWLPNLIGSILFLVAAGFAWLEVFRDENVRIFFSVTWWIIWINLLGSMLFQRSAFRSFVYVDSGELVNETIALSATLYGAVCFFIGAYLLIIEMKEPEQNRADST